MANLNQIVASKCKKNKKSLTQRKTQPKVVRTVLSTPRLQYRPIVNVETDQVLKVLLETYLQIFRKEHQRTPWSELKNVPKPERAAIRMKFQKTSENSLDLNFRKCLICGLNAVTRGLEKGEVNAVLLAEDIDPPLMSEHIIRQCITTKTPILLVPSLRTVTENVLNYRAIALGFAIRSNCSYFEVVINKITDIRNSLHPYASTNELELGKFEHSSMEIDDNEIKSASNVKISHTKELDYTKLYEELERHRKSIYLYRNSTTERVFVPPRAGTFKSNIDMTKSSSSDFLSLNVVQDEPSQYLPVNVKRVKANPNRKRKKH